MRAVLLCWPLLPAALRRRWWWLVPVGAGAALLDLATGVLLLAVASQLGGTGRAPLATAGWPPPVALGLLAGLVLAKAAVRLVETAQREAAAEATTAALGERLLHSWLAAPWRRQLATTAAARVDDVQALANDVGREGLPSLILFWSEGLVVLVLLALLLAVAPLPALGVLALCGAVAAATLRVAHRRHAGGVTALGPARLRLQTFVQGCVAGTRQIRLHGGIAFCRQRYRERRAELGRALVALELWKQVPQQVNEALFLLGAVALLAFVAPTGAAPMLLLFLYAGLRLLPALNRLVYRALALRAAGPAARRLHAVLREPVVPEQDPQTPAAPARTLTITDAWFTYPGREEPALAGATLTVRAGERLAIVGPSGGGKSTLLLLIAGLLAPDRGEVRRDGQPLVPDDPGWQRQLGWATQETFILEDTLRANIALGVPPDAVDAGALATVARLAQLEDVLRVLPAGLETRLSEGGPELSGGQRQRVALARELYRQPRLLLLDEGTAFLDQPVERQVLAGLAAERPGLTLIWVTHRLASLDCADRVAFVRGGRVEACGPAAELEAAHEGYRAFLAAARAQA